MLPDKRFVPHMLQEVTAGFGGRAVAFFCVAPAKNAKCGKHFAFFYLQRCVAAPQGGAASCFRRPGFREIQNHNAPAFVKGGRGQTERKDALLRLLTNGSIILLDQLPHAAQNPCRRAVRKPREICI